MKWWLPIFGLGLFVASLSGQEPELRQADVPFLVVDDQLLDATVYSRNSDGTIGPQGTYFEWNVPSSAQRKVPYKFPGWDFGVVPISFSPDATPQQRAMFMRACEAWGTAAAVTCLERTGQSGYLEVRVGSGDPNVPSPCYAFHGQARRLTAYFVNLGPSCWTDGTVTHELGHALGFVHEHQRPDRDNYVQIDLSNVPANAHGAFSKGTLPFAVTLGTYDFLSIMHYAATAFAIDRNRPTISPLPAFASYATLLGSRTLSALDHEAMAHFYSGAIRRVDPLAPIEPTRRSFNRNDFLDAMERLDAFYYSRQGLHRPAGLSIERRPDFLGIATWIFDVYLKARSSGYTSEQSFAIVVADITQTDEWRGKHPGQAPLTRPRLTPAIAFDRGEFLSVLQKLDAFYASPEGLQRQDGLSIGGGPDFLGIATWIFDVYLNRRLSGDAPNVAWTVVVNAIQATPEWRQKH